MRGGGGGEDSVLPLWLLAPKKRGWHKVKVVQRVQTPPLH